MVWIHDSNGTRWHDDPPRKRRKPPRALRFAKLKVGDQLVLRPAASWYRKIPHYYVVTDLWFDPVIGQHDPVRGEMFAIQAIGPDGEPRGHKWAHTRRGLASQRYNYADIDFIAQCKAFIAAKASGKAVGIGMGQAIRRRPKQPGGLL